MGETNIVMDRLNDFNWTTWKFRMELLLMKDNLWTTVKNEKPEEITSAWTRNDERARAMIGLALEDNQLSHIIGVSSAKEMWDKLKGYHERGSLTNKIHFLKKLCSMRLMEDGSMSAHLVQASELVHRLASLGEPLKDHLVVAILMSSLPESYNPLITALEGRPEEDLKLDYVKGKLLDEWRRRNEGQMDENTNGENAMKAVVRLEERKIVRRNCYYCKRRGHLIRNCHVLLEKQKAEVNEQLNPRIKQRKSNNQDSSSRGMCFVAATRRNRSTHGRWILDTGSSEHMTGSTASFEGMTFCQRRVHLADGKTVTAGGVGHGRIVGAGMSGGSTDMQLKELLYVPGLNGSVLSVSKIASDGYDVIFGAKYCSIQEDNKVVAIGERIDGLYYLR